MPGYQIREEQRQAIGAITAAFAQKNGIAIIEAGTGVGKTLAYLIPSLLHARSDRKVMISTHTLALQAQLWERDIPLVQSLMLRDVKAAIMKGRGNYLCLQDLSVAAGDILNIDDPLFTKLRQWAKSTETGDVADLPFNYPNWSDVRVDVDTCKGRECRFYDDCFYYKARRAASEASVVLVNHALLLSDIALRHADPDASCLPDASFIVLDEAHHIEDCASGAFGVSLSSSRLPHLIGKIKRISAMAEISDDLLKSLDAESKMLFDPFFSSPKQEFFIEECIGANMTELKELAAHLSFNLAEASSKIGKIDASGDQTLKDRVDGLTKQIGRAREELTLMFFGIQDNYFRWGSVSSPENKASFAVLNYTPVSVAPFLAETLFAVDRQYGVAMLSATLATNGNFSYIRGRLGISENEQTAELVAASPFPYDKHCLLYVPRSFPPPSDSPDYLDLVAREMMELVSISGGGAFLLFTSHRMLRQVHDIFSRAGLPYPILRQGDLPTGRLAQEFREKENSILFGAQSFWEGVDMPGDALRLVVIDRLPFAMPDSPINRARVDAIKQAGGDWFRDNALPEAQLRLKQGFGRLIRSSTDKGVVAILDSRIVTKNYGYQFIRSLPPVKRTFKRDDVAKFYASFPSP
jgi:ATP-dependent DNA helicase DinG